MVIHRLPRDAVRLCAAVVQHDRVLIGAAHTHDIALPVRFQAILRVPGIIDDHQAALHLCQLVEGHGIAPELRVIIREVVAGLQRFLLLRPPVLRKDLFPVLCQRVTDLLEAMLPDDLPELFIFELVLVIQLRDRLDPRPAYGIESPDRQVQICDFHLTNHVLSCKI